MTHGQERRQTAPQDPDQEISETTALMEDLNAAYQGLCRLVAADYSPDMWESTEKNALLLVGLRKFAEVMQTIASIKPGAVEFIGLHQDLVSGFSELVDLYDAVMAKNEAFQKADVPLEENFLHALHELVQDLEMFAYLIRSLALLPTPDKDDDIVEGEYTVNDDAFVEVYLKQAVVQLYDLLGEIRTKV